MKFLSFAGAIIAGILVLGYILFSPFPGAPARAADGVQNLTQRDGRVIEFFVQGAGPRVILLASAGRSVSDFNELTSVLVLAGYRTIAIEAPGIGASALPDAPLSLFDLADDVAQVIRQENQTSGPARTIVLGHAFGNRVARAAVTKYASEIDGVILLAAGGHRPVPAEAVQALKNCFDPRRTARQRLGDLRVAFFAEENDIPDHWRRGWYRHAAKMQGAATGATPSDDWLAGGEGPMLILQASEDRIAPKKDSSDLLQRDYPDRVEVVVIENAGHALLPEQPDAIAAAALAFLKKVALVN